MDSPRDIRREIYPYPEADYCGSIKLEQIADRRGVLWEKADSVACSINGIYFIRDRGFERDFPHLTFFAYVNKEVKRNFEFPQYYGLIRTGENEGGDFLLTVSPSMIEIQASSEEVRAQVKEVLSRHKEELGKPTQ